MLPWRWTGMRGELAAAVVFQAPACCEIMRRRPAAPLRARCGRHRGRCRLLGVGGLCCSCTHLTCVLATRACFLWHRTTAANPGKLLKKLRKQRMAATKGIVKGQK